MHSYPKRGSGPSDPNDAEIIAYFGKRFTKGQRHYAPTTKECCGVVVAIQHSRPHPWGRHYHCVTDQSALTYLYYM